MTNWTPGWERFSNREEWEEAMLKDTEITNLWEQFVDAIDKAYAERNHDWQDDPRHELRDYATNASMSDDLGKLVEAETAYERQHRKARPFEPTNQFYCNARSAARLLLLEGVANLVRDYQGGHQDAMPSSLRWLKIRRTVAEAELLGWIVRDYLTREWVLAVEAIDYTKLHN